MLKVGSLPENWWREKQVKEGRELTLRGVIIQRKQMKSFSFYLLQTSSEVLQVINTETISTGQFVQVTGVPKKAKVKNSLVKNNQIEIEANKIVVLSTPADLPFDLSKPDLNINNEILFNERMYSLRHLKQRSIFKVQNTITKAFREFFENLGLFEMRTPKIVKEGAEGGANIFSLEYFGKTAYLTQSPQFYKEFGVGAFGGVYEIGPVFRAEKHNTSRHLSEYTSVDVELGFINSFEEIMQVETEALRNVFKNLKENCRFELELLGAQLSFPEYIPAITFNEAKEITGGGEEENDLSPSEEVLLSNWALENHGSEFIFVTHFPESKRPFYTFLNPQNKSETFSFDLLYRGVEITTGGQRIHEYEQIVNRLESKGMNPVEFEFFTKAHRYGLPPHGGFGLGLERLTAKILGLSNVKEATLYPRDTTRLSP